MLLEPASTQLLLPPPGVQITAKPKPFSNEVVYATAPLGMSLAEMFPDADPLTVVTVNGEPVPREYWRSVRPKACALVHVYRRVQGGDDNKVLRTVLQVVVAVVALYTGNILLDGGHFFYAAASSVGITVLGNLAINALVPPQMPQLSATNSGDSFNRKFSLTGTRNRPNPYGVVPDVLGSHKLFPPFCAKPYTEVLGEEQYLRGMLCVGKGPLDITDIKVGTTPIEELSDDIEYEIVEYPAQSPTLYTNSPTEESLSLAFDGVDSPNQEFIRTSDVDADELSVDITFPHGIFAIHDALTTYGVDVKMKVEYRLTGTADPWINAAASPSLQKSAEWITNDSVEFTFYAVRRETRRAGLRWKVPPGQYDVRMTFVNATSLEEDQGNWYYKPTWTALRTFTYENPFSIPGTVLFSFRMLATGRLNGIVDRINMIATRRAPVWDGNAWIEQATRNPAWAFAHVLCGPAARSPLDKDAELDKAELLAWANECTANGWEFNGVIDSPTTQAQLLDDICAVGRARKTIRGGKYTIIRDVEQTVPVQMFTPRNASGFRWSRDFKELPHALRVRYVEPDADWQQDEFIVYRSGFDESTATEFETLELRGVTGYEHAWHLAMYHILVMEHRGSSMTFNADWENLACKEGDCVSVAHGMIRRGLAYARITAVQTDVNGDVVQATIDDAVTLEPGKTYALRVRKNDGTQIQQAITTPAGADIDTFDLAVPMEGVDIEDLVVVGEIDHVVRLMKVQAVLAGPDLSASLRVVPLGNEVFSEDATVPPAHQTQASSVIDPAMAQCCPPQIRPENVTSDPNVQPPTQSGGVVPYKWRIKVDHLIAEQF